MCVQRLTPPSRRLAKSEWKHAQQADVIKGVGRRDLRAPLCLGDSLAKGIPRSDSFIREIALQQGDSGWQKTRSAACTSRKKRAHLQRRRTGQDITSAARAA